MPAFSHRAADGTGPSLAAAVVKQQVSCQPGTADIFQQVCQPGQDMSFGAPRSWRCDLQEPLREECRPPAAECSCKVRRLFSPETCEGSKKQLMKKGYHMASSMLHSGAAMLSSICR